MCNCVKIVKTTDIIDVGDIVELEIPEIELRHGQRIRICFAQTPPALSQVAKVDVLVNGQKIPVVQSRMQDAFGAVSFLYSDQLQNCCGQIKPRQFIDVIFGADTVSFNYVGPCRWLRRANALFPRIPIPTPASFKAEKEKIGK